MFTKASLLIVLTQLVLISTAHAYTPPIGIPDPSFGIDEQAPAWPSQWPSAQATNFYFVDNTHPQATDTNNPNGYPNKPRASIPTSTSFAPGSYVELQGGPYIGTNYINLTFNCTAQAPCWFRGPDANNMPVLSGMGISANNSQYVIFENLDFANGPYGGYGVNGSSDHISFRNSTIRDKVFIGNTAGVSMLPNMGGTITDIVVYNLKMHDLGDPTSQVDQDWHGVLPSLWGRDSTTTLKNVWILNNECTRISGNCVQVNAGNWTNSYQYLHHIYIGFNKGYNNRQAAFWSKQASDVIMSQNEAYSGRQNGAQPGDGMGYQYGYR